MNTPKSIFKDLLDDESVEPPDTRQYSSLQQAIFEEIKQPTQNILIQAVAGSGKTTTIIKAMDYAPGTSLFMAFNKAIAEDIRRKTSVGDVKTLNALGHKLWAENRPRAKLNARKQIEILKQIMGDSDDFREYGYSLSRVCGLAKNNAFGLVHRPEAEDFVGLIDNYGFDIPADRVEDFAFVCREGFERSRLDEATFDFDDQLWTPVYERWQFPKYDNVLIDEGQDMSPIQHLMAYDLWVNGARLTVVGDRHQAIYGFRGASHGSMDFLKTKFQMKEMPLSISYRCSQSVVLAAQEFCPEIQCRDGAPQGELFYNSEDPLKWDHFMVICRNNAPLFKEILRCVRNQEPCQVLSNFLDSFQGFIRGFKATYTSDLEAKLDRWFERESEAAKAKRQRGKLQSLTDRYDTIKLLCREFKLVADMVQMVKRLGESTRGPIFVTIHKSKGLEHEHVYLLRPDLLGGFGELTAEQQQQEENLHYVGITRAIETLTYGAKRY
jgi:DNA helicase II / ATP-dependent DNA helicase PcrA